MMEKEPKFYHDLLLAIYPCKVPFTLAVKEDKPKTRLGTYYSSSKRIIIHLGWSGKYDMVETAIHEYAHHVHYTEFDKSGRKQAPHGKEFWQIYGQLMCRAKELGICNDCRATVIDFPRNPACLPASGVRNDTVSGIYKGDAELNPGEMSEPGIGKVLKELFRIVYNWLNG